MSETAMLKTARILSDIVYGIGAAIVITLFGITLFGSDQPANPDAMIPASPKELAFIWLAIGTILMLPACMAVYKFNAIKQPQQEAEICPYLPAGLYLQYMCANYYRPGDFRGD